jgi:peptidoglycan-associated lipoprotein
MKKNECLVIFLVMILSVVFFTVSCAKEATQAEPTQTAEPEASNEPVQAAEENPQAETDQPAAAAADSGEADKQAFMAEKVFFEFDSALLTDQARQILLQKADFLRSRADLTVTVEGHCDERGTEAYNMALGQRRAESVKSFLADMGIRVDRLNTISYGEEQPAVLGSNESAWAQNRRSQFVIE